jgi:hypothetical protein
MPEVLLPVSRTQSKVMGKRTIRNLQEDMADGDTAGDSHMKLIDIMGLPVAPYSADVNWSNFLTEASEK